jgi:hypothetical protein
MQDVKMKLYKNGCVYLFLIIPLIIILIFLIYILISTEHVCLEYKTIKIIGGCNRNFCGVEFTDGAFGKVEHPVIGKSVCLKIQRRRSFPCQSKNEALNRSKG